MRPVSATADDGADARGFAAGIHKKAIREILEAEAARRARG